MKIPIIFRTIIFALCILFSLSSCNPSSDANNTAPVSENAPEASDNKSAKIPSVQDPDNKSAETISELKSDSFSDSSTKNPEPNNIDFAAFTLKNPDIPFTPSSITPEIEPYSIAPDLSNIENIAQFNLTESQKNMLLQNHFAVSPTDHQQFSYLYDENLYSNIPNFITADSVLQVYKLFFDYSLRNIEEESLLPVLRLMTANMLDKSIETYYSYPHLSAEMEKIVAYFTVPAQLLKLDMPDDIPEASVDLAQKELKLINSAEGYAESPITGEIVLYENFLIRGHYTRNEKLSAYFPPMMWYGTVYFPIYNDDNTVNISGCTSSLLISSMLFSLPPESGFDLWESIYSPTAFYVGESDDVTPYEMYGALNTVLGGPANLESFANPGITDKYPEIAVLLREPGIVGKFTGESVYTGLQFRFMGQRYIPDSQILQNLSEPILRPIPSGLDIFAVLGSERAKEIINATENPSLKWPKYTDRFNKEEEYFASLDERVWKSNMYFSLIWTLKGFTKAYPEGYPYFMQTPAWQDKSLATGLSAWAQLRHDTILYGKASGAQMGGWITEDMGYVEPNLEVYEKLLWLTRFSAQNLKERDMLGKDQYLESKLEQIEEMLERLIKISILELTGQPIPETDMNWILYFGGTLESLSVSISTGGEAYKWYEVTLETDRNMALIADVHNTSTSFLEAGVGNAAQIYVIVPYDGKLYLTRGAVYDYYEFISDIKLTDEKWQSILETDYAPERPVWAKSFITEE